MKINSFCVTVVKDNIVIVHERPTDFDTAAKKYNAYVEEHFRFNHKIGGQCYGGENLYSNLWFEKKIREWKGDTNIILNMVVGLYFSSSRSGLQISLLHSSKA